MGLIVLLLLTALSFLVISCQPPVIKDQTLSAGNATLPSPNLREESSSEQTMPSSLPAGACVEGWICISSSQRRQRLENCSFTNQKQDCPYGCFNGTCQRKVSTVCTSGFKCINDQLKGYQLEDCSFINEVLCEYGCEAAKCLPKPNVTEAEAIQAKTSSPAPPSPPPAFPRLQVGEKVNITTGGPERTLSIYILEPERLKLQLDTFKSDWLREQQNYTFGVGVTIIVREILFQEFEGGKREIAYEAR